MFDENYFKKDWCDYLKSGESVGRPCLFLQEVTVADDGEVGVEHVESEIK